MSGEVVIVSFAITVVVLCFIAIHMLEMCAFIARYAGISNGYKAFGFTLNRSVMMLTRFFTMLLMPLLGLIVDVKIENEKFMLMMHASLFGAGLMSFFVYGKQNKLKQVFKDIIYSYRSHGALLRNILLIPFFYIRVKNIDNRYGKIYLTIKSVIKDPVSRYVLISSVFVYTIYSLSVFIAFFAALNMYEYRASIGQLSAVTNALATVLLTFYVEPKMARRMDESIYLSYKDNNAIMLGRVVGVSVVSQLFLLPLWLVI